MIEFLKRLLHWWKYRNLPRLSWEEGDNEIDGKTRAVYIRKTTKEMLQLDAEVAQKVMGWTPVLFCGQPAWKRESGEPLMQCDWYPTSDITQAFEVLNKIDKLVALVRSPSKSWSVECGDVEAMNLVAKDSKLSIAIVKAALAQK